MCSFTRNTIDSRSIRRSVVSQMLHTRTLQTGVAQEPATKHCPASTSLTQNSTLQSGMPQQLDASETLEMQFSNSLTQNRILPGPRQNKKEFFFRSFVLYFCSFLLSLCFLPALLPSFLPAWLLPCRAPSHPKRMENGPSTSNQRKSSALYTQERDTPSLDAISSAPHCSEHVGNPPKGRAST